MGMNPNYRRWGVAQWRSRAPTVGRLIDERWTVFAGCEVCDLTMDVRLEVVAQARGRDFSLWGGRSVRCRRRHCLGRMRFYVIARPEEGPMWME